MKNYDICFRDSLHVIIDKISFCATYDDALRMLSLITIGYSEKTFPVYAELNIGEKTYCIYEITVR